MADSFVHLHVHTEYSMLDGAARLKQMFEEVGRQKMPAIAMTDHGNMHGAYEFHKHAMAAGVTPIIGCLLPGQEILTSEGAKNVEDVREGDLVLTHRGRFRRVLRTMRRAYSGRAYTIELAGRYGRTLTLTEEHPVLVRTPDGLVDWKKPGDITAGRRTVRGGARGWNSWACLPKLAAEQRTFDILPLLPGGFAEDSAGGVRRAYEAECRADQSWPALPRRIALDHEFGYLLGLYAAEGHLQTRAGELTGEIGLTLHHAEQELGDRWRRLLHRHGIAAQTYHRPGKGSQEIKACCVPLAFVLDRLVGRGAADKRIPQCVLSGPVEFRAGFLDGFLDGDGRSPRPESNPSGRRDIKVASQSLAWGVRALLADRGHWSTVSSGTEKGRFPQGESDQDYRWYQVSYHPERAYSRTLEDDDYLYRPIRQVEPIDLECEVFNFEVEEDNSYVSDFILHNCEAYLAPESRYHKKKVQWGEPSQKRDDVSGGGLINHKTLWARNRTGLHNMFKLSSRAYTEGFVFKYARMDEELLAEHAEGVMATTGCPSGKVQTRLRLGQFDEALRAAATFQDIFGKENYFLELMDHGLEIERRVRDGLVEIGKRLNIPPVVTNDSHYTHESESTAHDALLCVQVGKQLADPDRFRFDGSGYYLKTADEMRAIDSSDIWAEGCRNTLLIAERVESDGMFEYKDLSPRFPVPEGETEESWFRKEVWKGLERRFPDGLPDGYKEQAEYEMGVILGKGYPSYFLVVADFIMWAKENGILVGPGRGSAAGSLIAYAMGITDLDPIPHGLIFERFLNPERASMPDIDIDFPEDRRAEVIKYTTEKWGADKVSFIATFGTIKAKAAIKDAGRVLGFPYALGDRISKAFPPTVMGKDIPLSGIFDDKHPRHGEAGELRKLYEEETDVKQIMDLAQGLEGLIRQTGVHAAGVIMSGETITDHIPIMRRDADGAIITQFDYPTCETLGLLKMDFLGLRNLTIIDDALQGIKKNKGVDVDLLALPLDDQPTYDLLARGDTLGVFQFDGGPMRSLLRLMKPDNFEDISAVGALYRPGPMGANSHTNYALRKNGQQEITPIHPELEEPLKEILDTTYGLIVYQEQVMAIAQKVAGYTLGKADLLRRVMGKKKKAELDAQFVGFEQGMIDNGFSKEAVKTLWDILVPFSDYAFNKAHSAAYGLVSYWTAYLKANYPAEYMAGLLTSVGDDKDKSALYLSECRRMGLKVLPPDVNTSEADFTPLGDTEIRFGLSAVRNVGTNVVDGIVAARKEKGAYADFNDFLSKVPPIVCNKRVVESLIKAGAFDELDHQRKALLMVHEQAIDSVIDIKRKEAVGQDSLFGALEDDGADDAFAVTIPEAEEWDKTTLLAFEREMLGLYVSDHPLLGVEHILEREADCTIAVLNEGERPDGQIVIVAGLLSGLQRKVTKQGNSWAMFQLEDLGGSIEVLCFPSSYQLCSTLLAEDAILIVKGRLDRREDVAKIIAMEVAQPDLTITDATGPFPITMPLGRCTPPMVSRLKEVLVTHPGRSEVHLHVQNGPRTTVVRLDDRLRVAPSPALMGDLKQLLGPSCLG